MSVKFYQFGKLVGGTDSSGNQSIPDEAGYGIPDIHGGTLPIGVTTINFAQPTKRIHVLNVDDTNAFEVSLDGATWLDIDPYGDIDEPVQISSVQLRSTVAGVSYVVVGILSSS